MPDRYSYSSPWSRGNQPWFRIPLPGQAGHLDVTTTVAVIGMGLISMFVWAAEAGDHELTTRLVLASKDLIGVGSVLDGQFWRLVTWPLVNEPDIWIIILFAVFYMLGNQLENLMGRRPFMFFLLGLTLIPAIFVTLLEILFPGFEGAAFGLRFVELGVLVAFAAQYPTARFWPGIPAWGIAAVIVGLDFLQALGNRDQGGDFELALLVAVVGVSLLGIRSFGYANELEWLPRIPLPASITGSASPRPASRPKRTRSRGRGNLKAVPPPSTSPASDRNLDMEIDALLDQVAERGLDSLTKEQRKRLEDHSKRLRKRRGE